MLLNAVGGTERAVATATSNTFAKFHFIHTIMYYVSSLIPSRMNPFLNLIPNTFRANLFVWYS